MGTSISKICQCAQVLVPATVIINNSLVGKTSVRGSFLERMLLLNVGNSKLKAQMKYFSIYSDVKGGVAAKLSSGNIDDLRKERWSQ